MSSEIFLGIISFSTRGERALELRMWCFTSNTEIFFNRNSLLFLFLLCPFCKNLVALVKFSLF